MPESSSEWLPGTETRPPASNSTPPCRACTPSRPAGDAATLATAGGVTSNMKQTTPGVFTSTLGIGGTNFNIVADTSKSPKALDVTEPRLGCRWNAVAP